MNDDILIENEFENFDESKAIDAYDSNPEIDSENEESVISSEKTNTIEFSRKKQKLESLKLSKKQYAAATFEQTSCARPRIALPDRFRHWQAWKKFRGVSPLVPRLLVQIPYRFAFPLQCFSESSHCPHL